MLVPVDMKATQQLIVKQRHHIWETGFFLGSSYGGLFSADICEERHLFYREPAKEVECVLTWQRVVCRGDVQRWCIGDTGHMVAFLPLPVAEPNHQTEHGHDEQQQEDDAQDSAGRLALWGECRTDLGVRVQFLHHQGRWRAQQALYWVHI